MKIDNVKLMGLRSALKTADMAHWCSWLTRLTVYQEIAGSSPAWVATGFFYPVFLLEYWRMPQVLGIT